MPQSDDELFAIARRAARAFAGLPNVHGVGIGGRERGGKPTGEIVLKVLVSRKLPMEQLDPGASIPPTFEGIPTDVVRAGVPRPHVAPGSRPLDTYEEREAGRDRARERPLLGGTVIMPDDESGVGTMGLIVEALEDDRMVFGITNYHVLFASAAAEIPDYVVGQPTPKRSCTACCRGIIGKYFRGLTSPSLHDDPNAIDYALIRLDPGLEWLNEIKETGVVEGTYNMKLADIQALDYQVTKRGATTRLTGGVVHSIGVVPVPHAEPSILTDLQAWLHHFQDYSILIRPNPLPGAPADPVIFGTHGDSGAALINSARQVVGLFWGGEDEHTDPDPAVSHWGYGYGFPISRIENDMNQRLGLTLTIHPTAGEGIVNRVPELAGLVAEPRAESRLERDLDRTERGRLFLTAWLRHSDELNAIVQSQRRVATVWQRHNGAALLRMVAQAPLEPSRVLPTEIDGASVREGLSLFLSQVDRYASDGLRQDLADHRQLLLSLPGRSYEDVLRGLDGPRQ